jgi:hypothetical protein
MSITLEYAKQISGDLRREIQPFCKKMLVCGSVRRQKSHRVSHPEGGNISMKRI